MRATSYKCGRRTQAHLRASRVSSGLRHTSEQAGLLGVAPSQLHLRALRCVGGKQTSEQGNSGCADAMPVVANSTATAATAIRFITRTFYVGANPAWRRIS